ncbi:ferredoxin [Methylobacterium oryzae]|uniref:Ferredoxin n=1 Tax=Methylobacterium oryzae TaxID=334852 RepID=A0ABU7TV95_9HYPH
MRVVVDLNRCQGYAQRRSAAPDHFEVRGHEIPFYDPAAPEAKRSQIERAQHPRPVRAIKVEAAGLSEEMET